MKCLLFRSLSISIFSVLAFGSFNVASASTGSGCVIAGPENAPVTIEEFADFGCHFCVKGAVTIQRVLQDYPGQVRVVFRNLPLVVHANSELAAKAFSAVCMRDKSKAFSFQEALFQRSNEISGSGQILIEQIASQLGLDVAQLRMDMASPQVSQALAVDLLDAKKRGFSGTPSFVIGSQELRGAYPYADFKRMIDDEIQKASSLHAKN